MSTHAAKIGITQVVLSRVAMASPGMLVLPIIMQRLNRTVVSKPGRDYGPDRLVSWMFPAVDMSDGVRFVPPRRFDIPRTSKSYDPEVYSSISKVRSQRPAMFFYNKGYKYSIEISINFFLILTFVYVILGDWK